MKTALERRSGGVLLHPSSLPGPGFCGDFGENAHRFVDFLARAGLRIWQVLPLGPTHSDLCPYQSFSIHAGNPDYIDLYWLVGRGWLSREDAERGQVDAGAKQRALRLGCTAFHSRVESEPESAMAQAYAAFMRSADLWLEDYARFRAFRACFSQQPWSSWPDSLRDCETTACAERARHLKSEIGEICFQQFVFHCQWTELRH
ncbi:MAG: 4-alpha-glucanotransferase, partial [Gammaproteobacteria bacterium]